MSVEIIERVVTVALDIELSIDNYTTNFFDSLEEFFESLKMDSVIDYDSELKDVFVLSITNYNEARGDYSVAIDKKHVIEYINNFIKTLERREEYEVCGAFLKLKNKYKSLENEK